MTTYFIDSRKSGEEYDLFKKELDHDKLQHDDSPDDSLSISSMAGSGFDDADSDMMSDNNKCDPNDDSDSTDNTICNDKEDVFKEALRLLEEEETQRESTSPKDNETNEIAETMPDNEKETLIPNNLGPLHTVENNGEMLDLSDQAVPQSIMKSNNSRRKKGVYFGQEQFISPPVSNPESTAEIESVESSVNDASLSESE